jgi:hypothetical protein
MPGCEILLSVVKRCQNLDFPKRNFGSSKPNSAILQKQFLQNIQIKKNSDKSLKTQYPDNFIDVAQ